MMARLGDICEIVSGTTPKSNVSQYWDGEINWVTPAELNDDTTIIYESQRKITEQAIKDSNLKPFPAGTVILSSRAPIGKVAIAGVEMYCNQGFKNLICSERIHNKYLFWFLKGRTDFLNSLGRGATFKEISKSIVENIDIPLPPLETQKRYAASLDKVSGLIFLRKQQLAKLDELVKVRFVEMFGDPRVNAMGWHIVTVGELISNIESGWSGNGRQKKKLPGEIAVLKVSAVTKGYFIPDECKVLDNQEDIKKFVSPKKGDLLFSRANTKERVGATAIVEEDYPELILPDKLWRVCFTNSTNVFYMKYTLSSRSIREKFSAVSTGTSGSMYNVSMEKFRAINIPLPPLELQQQFAVFVMQSNKSKLTIQQSLDKLEALKKSLMQEYFV